MKSRSVDVLAFRCSSFVALAIVLVFWQNRLSYAGPGAGLRAEIVGARISADRRPIATIKLSDAKGQPLDLDDLDRDSSRFVIAVVSASRSGETAYHNYSLSRVAGNKFVYKGETREPTLTEMLQPDFDRGGMFTRVRPGIFTCTALPADYDHHATHVIGGELTRDKGKLVANLLCSSFHPAAKSKSNALWPRRLVVTLSRPVEISWRRELRSHLQGRRQRWQVCSDAGVGRGAQGTTGQGDCGLRAGLVQRQERDGAGVACAK